MGWSNATFAAYNRTINTPKGRREDGQAEFNINKQRLIGEGDDKGAEESRQHRQMRGDNGGDKALPQMSNISITQQSTS